jgi:glycosyltransferase involved in cell wall biosynthesis
MNTELRVCHVITGTDTGGAEIMLAKLLPAAQAEGIASSVISLTDIGPVGRELLGRGVPVHAMHMRKGPGDAARVFALRTRIARQRPHIVQTWLHHADLLGGVAARMAGVRAVVWNLRQSNLDPAVNKAQTLYFARACALLSRWLPKRIVCCSHAALEAHAALGYDRRRMVVIVNGFDIERFAPSNAARERIRRELAIGPHDFVVAMIARFDPQKDHRNFADAAARIAAERPGTHFVLAGEGIDTGNAALRDLITGSDAPAKWHLLGRRDDVAEVLAAADISVSSSVGEGFPNAVGEAMACAVPCVVTDVGDSAELVGECGRVVPPRDARALAAACVELARLAPEERRELGLAARQRVAANFTLARTRTRYHELYRVLAGLCAE